MRDGVRETVWLRVPVRLLVAAAVVVRERLRVTEPVRDLVSEADTVAELDLDRDRVRELDTVLDADFVAAGVRDWVSGVRDRLAVTEDPKHTRSWRSHVR